MRLLSHLPGSFKALSVAMAFVSRRRSACAVSSCSALAVSPKWSSPCLVLSGAWRDRREPRRVESHRSHHAHGFQPADSARRHVPGAGSRDGGCRERWASGGSGASARPSSPSSTSRLRRWRLPRLRWSSWVSSMRGPSQQSAVSCRAAGCRSCWRQPRMSSRNMAVVGFAARLMYRRRWPHTGRPSCALRSVACRADRSRPHDRGALRRSRPRCRRPALHPPLCEPVHVQAAHAREGACGDPAGAVRAVSRDEHRPGGRHGRAARQQGRVHGQHSAAVAMYCRDVAEAVGLDDGDRGDSISRACSTTWARSARPTRSSARMAR